MDIQKSIKRFTLTATASAIISLHAETAMAASCPVFITGSFLAGMVCDFDVGTGSSVTVGNGGEVGGINMVAYTPSSPSLIAINAGGIIDNSTGIGINISGSLLSNGISNDGTINASNAALQITNGSTVSGGISNGGIMNSTNGTGILINNNSTISGGISNSGTITADTVFVGMTIDSNSIIQGDVTNSGLISTDVGNGILLRSNSAISGGIFNTGTINSDAGSGLTALNSSNIQGNISNTGLISTAIDGISITHASTMGGSILNNGVINAGQNAISIFSAATISGSISNNGTIDGGNNGISISFSATVNGGISNSGTIHGDIFAINVSADSNVSHIDILGQNARVIGAVEATNSTVHITDGAIFTSEGSYNVNIFNIASNALFNMANTITATSVNNSGTLAIADTSKTIVGDYTQQTGGVFKTSISNPSNYGQLVVTGAIDLSQSGNIYLQVAPNALLHNGDIFANVISGNTLTTPTNGFNISDNSYIWSFIPTLNNASNGLNLTATINQSVYNICQGSFCQGAATAILGQIAAGNPIFSPYATLPTADELRVAFSQATPELTNENIQALQLITRSVMDIAPMWNTLRGKSAGDAMFYQPGKIWIKPYGGSMTQNERNSVPGFDTTVYGAVIGKDIQWDDWLFGGGFAAGGNTMHGKSILSVQSLDSQAYQGMVYGAKRLPNHVYFAGQGLIGFENNDTNRSIPLYASTATGSYNSWFTNLRVETGWSTYALSPNFVFTPAIDASFLYINQGSYQEMGSLMDLSIASNHNSSLVLGAYGNGAYHLSTQNQRDLTLTGYAGFAGNVINSQPQVSSTFIASGSTFSTFGVQFNEVVFRGGIGLSLTCPTNPLSIELNYDLQAGNNAYSGVGAATIKYKT